MEQNMREDASRAASVNTYALAQFLEFMQTNCNGQLKYFLAPNCVVDWFGKCVRDVNKIYEFLRYDVCLQYDHINFDKIVKCNPIEQGPIHMQTKKISTKRVEYIHPRNRPFAFASLKPYADSDIEDDEELQGDDSHDDEDVEMVAVQSPSGQKTPENAIVSTTTLFGGELTPPSSTTKVEVFTSESDDDSNDFDVRMERRAKRIKRTPRSSTPFSYLRRFPSSSASLERLRKPIADSVRTLRDDTSSEEEEDFEEDQRMLQINYSPLYYLEVIGMLKKRTPAYGVSLSLTPDGLTDREVRIAISYRKCLVDGQIQFALILYEHYNAQRNFPELRLQPRNLMSEFLAALNTETDQETADDVVGNVGRNVTVVNGEETVIGTVGSTNSADIAAVLETAAFTIEPPFRTPTKKTPNMPGTPRRKSRHAGVSGVKRFQSSTPSAPKRSAARNLRL